MAQSYGGVGKVKFSKSVGSLDLEMSRPPLQLMSLAQMATLQQKTHACYSAVNWIKFSFRCTNSCKIIRFNVRELIRRRFPVRIKSTMQIHTVRITY